MTLMSKLGAPPEDPTAAIARNLRAVFNARRGYAAAFQGFGLGDHLGRNLEAVRAGAVQPGAKPRADAIAADMAEQVRRFEPRLDGPVVRYGGMEGTQWACFEVSGFVLGEPQTFKVLFHITLHQVRVLPPPAVS